MVGSYPRFRMVQERGVCDDLRGWTDDVTISDIDLDTYPRPAKIGAKDNTNTTVHGILTV